ncbi:hypothetical protein E8E14_010881 [Neopestalotiopsis sp. 37M]|nr:hypothetical protein E8E14_010881 [Neopestalotiopsis sp. 37M]
MTNPLHSSAILKGMAEALPTHPTGDTTSDLSSSHEALALFAHACMASLGFRLLGFDEEKTIEAKCRELAPRLPENWNASFNSFDRIGGKAEIRGVAIEDDRIARAEVTIKDYVSNGSLPVRITLTSESQEDRSDLHDKLQAVFINEGRITDLANLIKVQIVQKLLPSLQKEGYEESPDDRAARQDAEESGRRGPRPNPQMPDPLPQPANPYGFEDPLNPPPRRPVPAGDFPPPGFEDPYDIHRPPGAGMAPGISPFGNLGADDLHPPGLGPHDPLRPSLGGGGLPRPGGSRGMHPTFDDLMGRDGGSSSGLDPQVPPGARYDPLGPGGHPRFGGRGPGSGNNWFGGNGGGPGGFGGGII